MIGAFAELCPVPTPVGDDCLSLNVWAPETGGSGLPVLFWIHGGGFAAGSGAEEVYNGSSFARDGVICVTINYRLAALGYINLSEHFDDLPDSANLGLLDQIAALEWVRDNIAAFGGDPASITVAGESAGGAAVASLLASPRARSMIRRAILQSPVPLRSVTAATASKIAAHVLDELGVKPGDVAALEGVSDQQIVDLSYRITDEVPDPRYADIYGELSGLGMAFVPTTDTTHLPVAVETALVTDAVHGIDVLLGCTEDEMGVFCNSVDGAPLPTGEGLRGLLDYLGAAKGLTGQQIVDIYRSKRPTDTPDLAIDSAILTDITFQVPLWRVADDLCGHTNVWAYQFAWQTPVLNGQRRAHHFLELPFVFDQLDCSQARRLTGDDPPRELAALVHGAWVAFARSGSPEHTDLPAWPQWDCEHHNVMNLDRKPELLTDARAYELALWDGVI